MRSENALVSLSGGMDSATLLADMVSHYGKEHVKAVGVKYPSKHNYHEQGAAIDLSIHYGVPFQIVDLDSLFHGFRSNLLKSGGAIPEGHYEAANMSQTVVPCRNMIFASVLAGLALSQNFNVVVMGVHAGDHHIYPDCRPGFVNAMKGAVATATEDKVTLLTPYLHISKAEILKVGLGLGVPFQLTRTCYTADLTACGQCGSCRERLEAFQLCGVEDPLPYANRHPNPGSKEA